MLDVAIVGAGPSGSWTAFLLARAGARVAILDASHPREKPCGGGLTARALALVAAAAPLAPREAVTIRRARFVATPGTGDTALDESSVSLDGTQALLVADRRTFDGRLLDAACAAGAQHTPARVTRIQRTSSGFTLESTSGRVSARVIVGADGANSLVRRSVSTPLRRDQLSIATGFYAHGATSREIVIELLTDPPGYLWSFPRPDHLAIGICAQADAGVTATVLRARAARWIEDWRLGSGARLEPYAWPIPSLPARDIPTLPLHGADWLLVGDAAGLVDPITREGIFFALQSGEFAARAIESNTLARYGAAVRTAILPELARAARLKAGFFRPRFTRLMVEALRQSPAIRGVMADLIAGAQPYRGLKRRLLGTLEARLAWKLLSALSGG